MGIPGALAGKNPPANAGDIRDMGSKGTATTPVFLPGEPLHTPNAGAQVQSLVGELDPHAATKDSAC